MATALTASEILGYITTLQRSLGGPARVEFSDGRAVTYADDPAKLKAIAYYESLLASVTSPARPRALILSPTSGVEC